MSNRQWPSTFADRVTYPLPGPPQMLRLLREGGFRGPHHPERAAREVPRVREALPTLDSGQSSLTWVGHATYLIRTGGIAVLADPIWSPVMPGRIRRVTDPGLAFDDLPPIDAVTISHNHYDHLDAPTLLRLPRSTEIVVPAALSRWFTRRGFVNVTELDWWEHTTVKGVRFDCVPVHHWSRRGAFDLNRTLWSGWVLRAPDGPRILHAGDSAYGPDFAEIGRKLPGIDVAMMPIGAYAPRWFMSPAHMDPIEAVRATADLGARRMATMHWGTFVLSQEPLLEPVELARKAWADEGRPREDLWDLALGESRVF